MRLHCISVPRLVEVEIRSVASNTYIYLTRRGVQQVSQEVRCYVSTHRTLNNTCNAQVSKISDVDSKVPWMFACQASSACCLSHTTCVLAPGYDLKSRIPSPESMHVAQLPHSFEDCAKAFCNGVAKFMEQAPEP